MYGRHTNKLSISNDFYNFLFVLVTRDIQYAYCITYIYLDDVTAV